MTRLEIPDYDDLSALEQRIQDLESFRTTVTQELLCKHLKKQAWERWNGEVPQSDDACETVLACKECDKELEVTSLHKNGKGPSTLGGKRVHRIGYKMNRWK